MRTLLRNAALALASAVAPGCASGWLYSHTTVPLDANYDATPVLGNTSRGDIKKLSYASFDIEWGDSGVGGIVERSQLAEVYYIDIEVLSVLGIWTQRWVHVYGSERAPAE